MWASQIEYLLKSSGHDLPKSLSPREMLSRLRNIPSDTYGNETEIDFEDEFDGNFVSSPSPSDSESDDCAQEIGNTGKLLIT